MIFPPLQQPQTIEAHVVRPLKIAPTPALLSTLRMPEGFHLTRWADGISNPRILKVRRGAVYTTQRTEMNVVMLRDTDGDGVADLQREVAHGADLHGLAFRGDWAYMVGIRKVWRAPVRQDGTFGPMQELMHDLPDAGQHPNRTIEVGPDGRLYISIGSTANDAVERNPYNATMLVCDLDGGHRAIFASGLRNTIGYDWDAQGRLFGWDQGIDWLGDDAQREEVNRIEKGFRYGWPFVYESGKTDQNAHLPQEKGYTIEGWLAESKGPDTTYTAHAAGMQMRFYRGSMFPVEYRGDAFATMHGSWNRRPPSGYELVRVRFENGRARSIVPFLTGFLQDPDGTPRQFGRLCGLAEMEDGSLLVGDDEHGALYRLSYGQTQTGMQDVDATKLSPDLVAAPRTMKVDLQALGLKNSEYARGPALSPRLDFSNVPYGTKALALAMEDPDAPSIKPVTHWLLANTGPNLRAIPADVGPGDVALGGVQGSNSHGTVGYYGPKPPVGDRPHRYVFTLYALDRKLGLKPGFNRLALIKALRGHVLAQGSSTGAFGKSP